eukprot:scaffold9308_cov136-Isochrysis_galbana.AAC.1
MSGQMAKRLNTAKIGHGAPSAPAECWSARPIIATHLLKLLHSPLEGKARCTQLGHHPSATDGLNKEKGVGNEWEGGEGVTGRHWTWVSRRAAASVSRGLSPDPAQHAAQLVR